jgi:hypothetical protein
MEYLLKFHAGLTGLDPRGCLRVGSSGLTTLNPLVTNGLREYLSRFLSLWGDDEAEDRTLLVDVLMMDVKNQISRLRNLDGVLECLRIIRYNITSILVDYGLDDDESSITDRLMNFMSHTYTLALSSEDDIRLSFRGFFLNPFD